MDYNVKQIFRAASGHISGTVNLGNFGIIYKTKLCRVIHKYFKVNIGKIHTRRSV